MSVLDLARDGAVRLPLAAKTVLNDLVARVADQPVRPGRRLTDHPHLAALLADGGINQLVRSRLRHAEPVRAILFDKSSAANWALSWHQDRVIAVRERHDVSGFSGWTVKHGTPHVSPPFGILERMVTIRIHLDAVFVTNAPLRVALETHRKSWTEQDIPDAVNAARRMDCLADAGDVWIYATPILHASDRASIPERRRVIQVDYSADRLPGPLAWAGI